MKIVSVDTGGNASSGAWWHIHAAGCQDIKKEVLQYRIGSQAVEVAKVADYIEDTIADLNADHGDGAFSAEHFRVMPCLGNKGGK